MKLKISKSVNQKFIIGIDLIEKYTEKSLVKFNEKSLVKFNQKFNEKSLVKFNNREENGYHLNCKLLEIQNEILSIDSIFKNKEIEYWGSKMSKKLLEMVDSVKREFVEIHQKMSHQLDKGLLLKQNYLASAGIRQDDAVDHLADHNRLEVDDSVGHLVDDDGLGLDDSTVFFDAHDNAASSPILACSMAKLKALEGVKKKIMLKNELICKEKASCIDELICKEKASFIDESLPTISTDLAELNEKWEIFCQAQKQLDLALESLQKDVEGLQRCKDTLLDSKEQLKSTRKSLQENTIKFRPSLAQFDAFLYLHITNKSKNQFEWNWMYYKVYQSLRSLFTKELFIDYGIECGEMKYETFIILCQILQVQTTSNLDHLKKKIENSTSSISQKAEIQTRLDLLLDSQSTFYSTSFIHDLNRILGERFKELDSTMDKIKNRLVPDILFADSGNCKELIEECMEILI